jgi:hypothetical protein
MPLLSVPARFRITRLRSVTFAPAALMLMASKPLPTTLPRAPGIARIVTDLVMFTVAVLKLAESSIQISPPGSTAASAAGSSLQGAGSVQAFASLPFNER